MSRILIIDIETTGFLPKGKIVEIGLVELSLENGNRKILFNEVTHEKGITQEEVENSWIVSNSDLAMEAIKHSVRLDRMQEKVQRIINDYPAGITAFNRNFDIKFMESRGFTFPKLLPCPMLLSTNICKIMGRRGYKWPKVQEAYDHFFEGNDYIETHRGADDAYHEAKIVYKLYELGVFRLD